MFRLEKTIQSTTAGTCCESRECHSDAKESHSLHVRAGWPRGEKNPPPAFVSPGERSAVTEQMVNPTFGPVTAPSFRGAGLEASCHGIRSASHGDHWISSLCVLRFWPSCHVQRMFAQCSSVQVIDTDIGRRSSPRSIPGTRVRRRDNGLLLCTDPRYCQLSATMGLCRLRNANFLWERVGTFMNFAG